MHTYLIKLVYQIVCGSGQHAAQFDEQLRVVVAGSAPEAVLKAQLLGMQEEECFFNGKDQLVRWLFVGATEMYALNGLDDGAEVFSQLREVDDAASFRALAQHKAAQLQLLLAEAPTLQVCTR